MRIVCDVCQTKYRIDETRIADRRVRVRCRKCSNLIEVASEVAASQRAAAESHTAAPSRPAAAAPAEPTPAAEPPQAAAPAEPAPAPSPSSMDAPWAQSLEPASAAGRVWQVSPDGTDHAPMEEADLRAQLGAGHLSWESYVWREGWDDWRAAREVPELTAAVSPAPLSAGDRWPGADPLASSAESRASVDGARESFIRGPETRAPTSTEPVASPPPGDAFAHAEPEPAPQPLGSGEPRPSDNREHPSPRRSSQDLLASRQESSVLFSLENLQQLARASHPSTSSAPPAGHAQGESSGIVDMRMLADLARTEREPEQVQPEQPAPSESDLLAETPSPVRLDSIAPLETPSGPERSGHSLMLGILGGSALLAAAVFVGILYLGEREQGLSTPAATATAADAKGTGSDTETPRKTTAPPAAAAAEPAATTAQPASPAAAGEPPAGGDHADAVDAPEPADREPAVRAEPGGTQPRARERQAKRRASRAQARRAKRARANKRADRADEQPSAGELLANKTPAPQPEDETRSAPQQPQAKATESDPKSGGAESLDSLLDRAVSDGEDEKGEKSAQPKAPAKADSDLPRQPSRGDTLKALRSVNAQVQRCASGHEGVAMANVKVRGANGRVASAQVSGVPSAAASCIADAIKQAKFPRFSQQTMTVRYPYRLR